MEQERIKRDYTVVYQEVEDGWVMASVPEIPGAVTQGRDLEEARSMIKEAVELLLESYRENAARESTSTAIWETLTVDFALA
jgi:predicted RNase H-like HicB family nuclease